MTTPKSPAPTRLDVGVASRLIKSALRATFPGVTFAVSSSRFAGGESLSVRWTDGPAEARVAKIAKVYEHVRRDARSGEELLGGNTHVSLNREFPKAKLDWARGKCHQGVRPSQGYGELEFAAGALLAKTSFPASKSK